MKGGFLNEETPGAKNGVSPVRIESNTSTTDDRSWSIAIMCSASPNAVASLSYPILAIGDLHGQSEEFDRLLDRVDRLAEWPDCAVVFLGDFVDRGPDSRKVIDRVLEILERPPGGAAVMGNHDLALVHAARLRSPEPPPHHYWLERYLSVYDAATTVRSYVGRTWSFEDEEKVRLALLEDLRAAMPETHRRFLAELPWVVEASGHLFLHCGLSPELDADALAQVEAMKRRCWDRSLLSPKPGTATDLYWQPDYPVWLGADRGLSNHPLRHPTKIQVTGHSQVPRPDANPARIRIDTSGGYGPLTACLLTSPTDPPHFISSWDHL